MTVTALRSAHDDHETALRERGTQVAQVAYACGVLGPEGLTTAGVRTWLTDHGVEVERSYASKIVNAWRKEQGLTSTGELALLTPEMITESVTAPVTETTGSPVEDSAIPDDMAPEAPASAPVADVASPEDLDVTGSRGHGVTPEGAPGTRASVGGRVAGRRVPAGVVRNISLVIPLLLVNAVAIIGQVAWAREHLDGGLPVAILFAGALESIALFLAAETHAALMNGDSSAPLRLASYVMALLAGTLNYLHYAPDVWSPTVTAVAFGILSTVSPWLWGVRSRSMHRAELRERGLIDPRAVRFAPIRWTLFPRQTFRAFRAAVWASETDPMRAVALIGGSR